MVMENIKEITENDKKMSYTNIKKKYIAQDSILTVVINCFLLIFININ